MKNYGVVAKITLYVGWICFAQGVVGITVLRIVGVWLMRARGFAACGCIHIIVRRGVKGKTWFVLVSGVLQLGC
ncbi:unnamed protein product [Lathyrus sativus]|nr:unnamed protein product [Lathyrus sativus]